MRNLIFFLALPLYHFLFWQQEPALNLVLFSSFLLAAQRILQKTAFRRQELLLLFPYLSATFGLLYFYSELSIGVFILSSISYLGYLNSRDQDSLVAKTINGALGFFSIRSGLVPEPGQFSFGGMKGLLRILQLVLLPLAIFLAFYLLLMAGNAIFKEWSEGAFGWLFELMEQVRVDYLFFMAFGILLARWYLRKHISRLITFGPLRGLMRKRKAFAGGMALKREYLRALILFASLNLLFLVVNYIDVRWVWFLFDLPQGFSLKDFVHEGAGWLVFTLFVSAFLIFYYFRGNLNFYPRDRWLRRLALLWIVQNGILAISVVIRTFHYIGFHGLADGRIALLILLLWVLVSLGFLFYKVLRQQSFHFVFRQSYAALLLILGSASLCDWDCITARVNLQHGQANEIDIAHYYYLHPRVYPLLYEHLDRIETQIKRHQQNEVRWSAVESIEEFKEVLDRRRDYFLKHHPEQGLGSWNYAEQRAYHRLLALQRSDEATAADK